VRKWSAVLALIASLSVFMLAGVIQALQGAAPPHSLLEPSAIAIVLLPPLIVLVTKHTSSQRRVFTMCLVFALVGLGILIVSSFVRSTLALTLLGVALPCIIAWSISMLVLRQAAGPARSVP
jgi:hypothetical protein